MMAIKRICRRLSEDVPSLAVKERTRLDKKEREQERKAKEKGEELFEYDDKGYVLKPRYSLITRSIVANHQTSDTFLDVEIDTHSAVHQRVESVLKKDSGFEQHIGSRRGRSKMLKIGENAGVDKTVELLQLVRITENNRSHDALINQTLRRQHLGRVKQPSHLLAEERVVVITSRHSIGFKTRNTELGKNI